MKKTQSDIEKWKRRFARVLKDFPKGYWIYVYNDEIAIMKLDENGQHAYTGGNNGIFSGYGHSCNGIDKDYIVYNDLPHIDITGGDW